MQARQLAFLEAEINSDSFHMFFLFMSKYKKGGSIFHPNIKLILIKNYKNVVSHIKCSSVSPTFSLSLPPSLPFSLSSSHPPFLSHSHTPPSLSHSPSISLLPPPPLPSLTPLLPFSFSHAVHLTPSPLGLYVRRGPRSSLLLPYLELGLPLDQNFVEVFGTCE